MPAEAMRGRRAAARVARTGGLVLLALASLSGHAPEPPRRLVLWAWERPEDLRFLGPSGAGVAFLWATVDLQEGAFSVRPRRQPLYLPAGLRPRATVRLQMVSGHSLAHVSETVRQQLVERLVELARQADATGLQLDFDARASEFEAYLALLTRLRARLPRDWPLSITGLASWCGPDSWLLRAPVDEVVPQLFRMGPEAAVYEARSRRGLAPPCGPSVGLAVDEWRALPARASTVYLFNPRPWTADAFSEAQRRLLP